MKRSLSIMLSCVFVLTMSVGGVFANEDIKNTSANEQPMYFAIGDSLGAGFGLDGFTNYVKFSKKKHKKRFNFTDTPNSYPALVKAGLNASDESLNGTYPALRATDMLRIFNGKIFSKEDADYRNEPYIVEMNKMGGLSRNNPKNFFVYLNNKTNYKIYIKTLREADVISVHFCNNDFTCLLNNVLDNPEHPLMLKLNQAMRELTGDDFDVKEVQRLLAADRSTRDNNLCELLGHMIRIGQEVTGVMDELNKVIKEAETTCIKTNTELVKYIKTECKVGAKVVVVGMYNPLNFKKADAKTKLLTKLASNLISPMVDKINCGIAKNAKCNGCVYADVSFVQPIMNNIMHTDAEGYKQMAKAILKAVKKASCKK